MLERDLLSRIRAMTAMMVVAAAAGLACGGSGDGGTNPPPPSPTVASVDVTLSTSTVVAGQTVQATATPKDASGNAVSGRTVSWSTSNTSVATVSANGTVTGVAEGTASVIATVDGKTGQASLTVEVAPVSEPTIEIESVTRDGQAVDLQHAAGRIDVTLNQDIPAGFVGTLTFSVDGKLLLEEPVRGPELRSESASGASARAVAGPAPVLYALNLSTVVATARQDGSGVDIDVLVKNGPNTMTAQLAGQLAGHPVSKQVQFPFTSFHPGTNLIWTSHDGSAVPGAGGHLYVVDGVRVIASRVAYEPAQEVDEIEVVAHTYEPIVPQGGGGVVDVHFAATKGQLDNTVSFDDTDFQFESPPEGTAWSARSILQGTNRLDLTLSYEVHQGVCFNKNGNGLATFDPQKLLPLPANCTQHVELAGWDTLTINGRQFAPAKEPQHYDWKATASLPGVFRLPEATGNLFDRIFQRGVRGFRDNRISGELVFSSLVDPTKVVDATADLSNITWHATTVANISQLGTPASVVDDADDLPETPTVYDIVMAGELRDGAGRPIQAAVTVTPANPRALNGISTNYGIDTAVMAKYTREPQVDIWQYPNDYVLTGIFDGTFSEQFRVNEPPGAPPNEYYVGMYVKLTNAQGTRDLLGAPGSPVIVAKGTSPVSVPTFRLQAAARDSTGSFDGLYGKVAYVADSYGNDVYMPMTNISWFSTDSRPPDVDITSFTPFPLNLGQAFQMKVDYADLETGVRSVAVGVRATGASSPWSQYCAPFQRIRISAGLPATWSKTGSVTIDGVAPTGVTIATPSGGVGPTLGYDALCVVADDMAGNTSAEKTLAVGPFTGVTPTDGILAHFGLVQPSTVSTGSDLTRGSTARTFLLRSDARIGTPSTNYFERVVATCLYSVGLLLPELGAAQSGGVQVGGSNFWRDDFNGEGRGFGTSDGPKTCYTVGQRPGGFVLVSPPLPITTIRKPYLESLAF